MTQRPIEVLLVEDSPGDVWLIREILMQGEVPKNIHVVVNGEQALHYLNQSGEYAAAPKPDVVLLDLNLPRRGGLEVLQEIKNDPALRTISVIVLTTSQAAFDVNAAYDLNANCYVVKPVELEEFTTAIRAIETFWMNLAALPTLLPPNKSDNAQASDPKGAESASEQPKKPSSSSHRKAQRLRTNSQTLRSAVLQRPTLRAGAGR